VALRRPELVDRMVLIGQYCNSSGRVSNSDLDRLLRSEEAMGFLRQAYDPVSPDGPDHFPVVFAKTMAMIDSEPELDLQQFATVRAPTLVCRVIGTRSRCSTAPRWPRPSGTAGSRCCRHTQPASRTARGREPAAGVVPA